MHLWSKYFSAKSFIILHFKKTTSFEQTSFTKITIQIVAVRIYVRKRFKWILLRKHFKSLNHKWKIYKKNLETLIYNRIKTHFNRIYTIIDIINAIRLAEYPPTYNVVVNNTCVSFTLLILSFIEWLHKSKFV